MVFASVVGVLGVGAGALLAFETERQIGGGQSYPYLGIGIGIAANAAFFALIGVVLGKLGQAYAATSRAAESPPTG